MLKHLFFLSFFFFISCAPKQTDGWKLVWEDDFNQAGGPDTATWSKIPRWHPDWAKYMSDNEACYDMADGNLILRGLVNPDRSSDTATYITGGVYTKFKRPFHGGRLEIKAKLEGATGAWPAIWLKPFEEEKYPEPESVTTFRLFVSGNVRVLRTERLSGLRTFSGRSGKGSGWRAGRTVLRS